MPVLGGVERHEIGVARIKAFAHLGCQLAHHHLVIVAHHHGHALLQAQLGKAGEQVDLVAASKVGHKHIGPRAGHLGQQPVNFCHVSAYGQVFFAHHITTEALQGPLGGINRAAWPFVVTARKKHFETKTLGHERQHLVDLLVGQGSKVKKVTPSDAAFVEREVQVRHAQWLGHLGSYSNARIGQQVADDGHAAVLIDQALGGGHGCVGQAAIVFDDQL